MEVQIFGVKKSSATRAAERFFKERRVKLHVVDLNERPMSRGELTRFVQKFKVDGLLDKDSKRYAELGLHVARYGDETWVEKFLEEPLLLRMPLVRWGAKLTVGEDAPTWKAWVAEGKP